MVAKLNATDAALLNYFLANAWANRQRASHVAKGAAWAWMQPEIEKQILYLRCARNGTGFDGLEPVRRCQILTNLANLLNTLGRFVEARDTWTQALVIDPNFWMARGNRGSALIDYGRSLYDEEQRLVFGLFAHRDLTQAAEDVLRNPYLGDPAVRDHFIARRAVIESALVPSDVERSYRPEGHSLGASDAERSYREWCLKQVLFLNPLNDIDTRSVAAHDILTLPDFTTNIGDPPALIGFFNQIKQEYVSARWGFYESTFADSPHFSDRALLLYNTLDYPSYGLAIERMRLTFRATYSIFDKIAFFLNHYMSVGLPEKGVNFKRIWRETDKSFVRAAFDDSKNWPLRGLYWLSRDLFDEEIHVSAEPEARELNTLRNHLEHKYLKVHEMLAPSLSEKTPADGLFVDTLSYSISREELERKTFKLLKLSRAALIYLSLGMHNEERRRKTRRGPVLVMPMSLPPLDDDWKR